MSVEFIFGEGGNGGVCSQDEGVDWWIMVGVVGERYPCIIEFSSNVRMTSCCQYIAPPSWFKGGSTFYG